MTSRQRSCKKWSLPAGFWVPTLDHYEQRFLGEITSTGAMTFAAATALLRALREAVEQHRISLPTAVSFAFLIGGRRMQYLVRYPESAA